MYRIAVKIVATGANGHYDALLKFKIGIQDVPTVENTRTAIDLVRKHYESMAEIYNESNITFDVCDFHGIDIGTMDDQHMLELFGVVESMRNDIDARFERHFKEKLIQFILYIGMGSYVEQDEEDTYSKMRLTTDESETFKVTIREICSNLSDIDYVDTKIDLCPTYNASLATPEVSQEMATFVRWIIKKYHTKPFNRNEYEPYVLAGFKHVCKYLDILERNDH